MWKFNRKAQKEASVRGRSGCTNPQSQAVKKLGHPGVIWPLQINGSTDEKQAAQTAYSMSEARGGGGSTIQGLFHIYSLPIYLSKDGFIFSGIKSQPVGKYQQMINKSMTLMTILTNTTILKHKKVLYSI